MRRPWIAASFLLVLSVGISTPVYGQVDAPASTDSLIAQGMEAYRLGTRMGMEKAIRLWSEAAAHYRQLGHQWNEAVTLNNVGLVHGDLGRPDSALVYFAQALELRRGVGHRRGEAATLNNIGAIHRNLGRPDSALIYNAQALPIHREVGDRRGEAVTLSNIGLVHYDLGRPDSALTYLAQALPVIDELGNSRGKAVTLNRIGAVQVDLGHPDSALAYLAQALRIMRGLSDLRGEAATLSNIGAVQDDVGHPDSALAYYVQALSIQREVGERRGMSVALGNIGRVHHALGNPDSALVYYGQALSIMREMGDRRSETATLSKIGFLFQSTLSTPNPRKAAAYYDSAAAVLASISRHAGGDQNRLSFAEQDVGLFFAWTLAWLALEEEVGPELSALSALAAAERGRAQALLDLMRQSATAAGLPVRAPGADLAAEGQALVDAATRGGSAALAYLVTPDTLLTWLATPDGELQVFRTPVVRTELAERVATLRGGLGAGSEPTRAHLARRGTPALEVSRSGLGLKAGLDSTSTEAAARQLAAWLLPPGLAEALEGAHGLVVVPHGPLNLLPFAALPLDGADEPLGVRYALRYTPSLAMLGEGTDDRANAGMQAADRIRARALVVGNPAMPRVRGASGEELVLGSLPAAEAEGRWVARQAGTTLLTAGAAGEATIKQRLPGSSLVHLATHGYAYSSEARARDSFIALAPTGAQDGLLTVGEVLDELPSLSAELVVLSACQTGLGDLNQAEGTVGLQRAFLAKGAQSVLVSLWSVSDAATELLMKRFYTHWLEDEDRPTKAEALRRAQVDVRTDPDHPEWADPRYWAAFQLVGGG